MSRTTGDLGLKDLDEIEEAFSCLSGLGRPVAVHCEDQDMNNKAASRYGFREHGPLVHALSRPAGSEAKAIRDALDFSGKYRVLLSVCHVSTMEGMNLIKSDGKAKAESTMYHPILDSRDLERLGAFGKMNPPLRERSDADYIMDSVLKGDADFIGTDHAPHTRQEKEMGFMEAPSGVPSIEHYGCFASLLLSRGMSPAGLARATSYNAARFFGLEDKARIEEGYVADLAVLDTMRPSEVKPPYQTKCGWSPLEGMEFPGRVSYTMRRGSIIAENGKVLV